MRRENKGKSISPPRSQTALPFALRVRLRHTVILSEGQSPQSKFCIAKSPQAESGVASLRMTGGGLCGDLRLVRRVLICRGFRTVRCPRLWRARKFALQTLRAPVPTGARALIFGWLQHPSYAGAKQKDLLPVGSRSFFSCIYSAQRGACAARIRTKTL